METIRVSLGETSYDIEIGAGALGSAARFAAGRKLFVIADSNVAELYLTKAQAAFGDFPYFVFPAGESSKDLATLESALERMLAAGLNRKSLIVALGGGVTGDIAGFAAGIYMRGIDFIQVPTTLLAQVDSSVGGKTGVDLAGVKNIVGVFHQPRAVFVDTDFLATLPPREKLCGMGECVKAAFLDEELYRFFFHTKWREAELISRCVRFKAGVVERDERESGLRKILNFGHTVGHALETLGMGGERSHGEYVLHGMLYEFALSRELGVCGEDYYRDSVKRIEKYIGPRLPFADAGALYEIMASDKKNDDRGVSFILPVSCGKVEEHVLGRAAVLRFLEGCR